MKIGTSMWGFREREWADVLSFCSDAGITTVEAQVHPQTPQHFRLGMPDAELDRIVSRATSIGITFDALTLANDFTAAAERMPAEVEGVIAGLALARRLGVTRVRVFAGWKRAADVDGPMFDRMIHALKVVAGRAADLGIRLALENHGGITATAGDVRRILDAVGHPSLGLLYDPVNFVRSGQDPVAALATLRASLVYTHAKDLAGDGTVCAVGDGTLAWPAILAELAQDPVGLMVIEQTDPTNVCEATQKSHTTIRSLVEAAAEVRR